MVCVCSPGGGALVVGYSVSPPPSFLTLDPLYSTIFYWWHSTALGARTSAYLAYLARTCAPDPTPMGLKPYPGVRYFKPTRTPTVPQPYPNWLFSATPHGATSRVGN